MTQDLPANSTFPTLIESRRRWIDDVLKPWSVRAVRKDLVLAELEWKDIAGRADPEATLWTWAWSRFPDLVHPQLPGVNETYEVRVTLKGGDTVVGYPDGRQSKQGRLWLVCRSNDATPRIEDAGPFSIDDIAKVERISA